LPLNIESGTDSPGINSVRNINTVQFKAGSAYSADKKLTLMWLVWLRASDVGIQRRDSVNQPELKEEIERPINRWWSSLAILL
jgi:hypothetical protein